MDIILKRHNVIIMKRTDLLPRAYFFFNNWLSNHLTLGVRDEDCPSNVSCVICHVFATPMLIKKYSKYINVSIYYNLRRLLTL